MSIGSPTPRLERMVESMEISPILSECAAGGEHRGFPFVAGGDIGERQRAQPLRGVENARQVFDALHVAREPIEIVGGAREHGFYSLPPCGGGQGKEKSACVFFSSVQHPGVLGAAALTGIYP